MDSKIIIKSFVFISLLISTQLNAIEFRGEFLQGHFIIGITDPSAKIIIDKKKVKVSKDGYFVFGLDRDRKFDVLVTQSLNGEKKVITKKVLKENIGFKESMVFLKIKLLHLSLSIKELKKKIML